MQLGVSLGIPYTLGKPAAVFSPLDLSPVLWLDASDTSTITESGGAVSQWDDKSGNGNHVTQATAAKQPTTGTVTQNGLNVIDFDGGDYLSRLTVGIGRNTSGMTMYVVYSLDSAPTSQIVIAQVRNAGDTGDRASLRGGFTSNKIDTVGRVLDTDSPTVVVSANNRDTSWGINTSVFDYANNDLFLFLNSTQEGSNLSFGSATTSSDTDAYSVAVGAANIGLYGMNGKIATVLMFHAAHDSATRTKVWTYLADKWGITL